MSTWLPPCWGSEMYCGHWEKGANCIIAHQRKWLLQQNYNICKMQACRPFHASLIGVVTGVGEQRYVYCLSLNQRNTFLTPPNMAVAKRTYESAQNVTSHAMGLLTSMYFNNTCNNNTDCIMIGRPHTLEQKISVCLMVLLPSNWALRYKV